MTMPDTARRWTAAMVRELPDDGNRYEVVHGVLLVMPAPRPVHQLVQAELNFRLATYLRPFDSGVHVFTSPADISWDDDTFVQPDPFVFPRSEFTGQWPGIRTLLLAIEIVSPSTRRPDRLLKRRLYQECQVATYWIVDADARLVEVWHPGDEAPELVAGTLRWQVAAEAPVLEIPLPDVFRDLLWE
jgi:Uma2 family endonuclease